MGTNMEESYAQDLAREEWEDELYVRFRPKCKWCKDPILGETAYYFETRGGWFWICCDCMEKHLEEVG